ncbi:MULTISPECIES: hypothetical protein [Lysobacteraceae]|nr:MULTISPECIES: hypothetical protein [Lysobacter]
MHIQERLLASPRRRFYVACLGAVALGYVTTIATPNIARFLVPAGLVVALAWVLRAHVQQHGGGSGRLVMAWAGTLLALLCCTLIGLGIAIAQQTGFRD